jgi:hypothetical protein
MVMRPFHSVTVRFGPPLAYDFAGDRVVTGSWEGADRTAGPEGSRTPGPDELRTLTDALMQAIAGLSGQEYVDEYASRKKTPSPGPAPAGAAAPEPSS